MGAAAVEVRFTVAPAARRVPAAERERILANPGFGKVFSEHMAIARWERTRGWHDAEVRPYGPIPMDPGTSDLHYAQAVFEGLKAYRLQDGRVAVFRPEANAARFKRSARRLALPELPEGAFVDAIDLLVGLDADWVPSAPEHSLYLRPFMYASEVNLSVHPSDEVTFVLIASPSGSYFPSGVKPVTVWLWETFSRSAAVVHGRGKTGRNLAGHLLAESQADVKAGGQVSSPVA